MLFGYANNAAQGIVPTLGVFGTVLLFMANIPLLPVVLASVSYHERMVKS